MIAPLIVASVAVYGVLKGVDVFSAAVEGAAEGLQVLARMLPALVALLTAVYMLRASGVLGMLADIAAPGLSAIGIPPELAVLVFLRPITGSGALAAASELIGQYGPDSLLGRTAAVMLGSTETTFYVIAVYFGAAGIKKSRYAIPAAICADIAGFVVAAYCVRLMWS